MQLDNLNAILPVPPSPVETHRRPWSAVEQEVGTQLPDDYKAFIEQYGSGRISEFIWVLNPFSSNQFINVCGQMVALLGALAALARDFGVPCPYPLFPHSGGLLPFAVTDNGDVLYWVTHGDPNTWRVVVNEARGPKYEEFALNATDFLAGILTHRVNCTVFPESLQDVAARFEPVLATESGGA
ncbi:MAG: SMI1/KNR4 family protein [Phycisphaerae bacterium]